MEFARGSDNKSDSRSKKVLIASHSRVGFISLILTMYDEFKAYQKFRAEAKKLGEQITPIDKKNKQTAYYLSQAYLLQLLFLETIIGIAQVALVLGTLDSVLRLVTRGDYKGFDHAVYQWGYNVATALTYPFRSVIHPILERTGLVGGKVASNLVIFAGNKIWALESIYPLLALLFYIALIRVMMATVRNSLKEVI